jgi:hypothetical protein
MPEQIHFRSAAPAQLRLNGKRLAGVLNQVISERSESDSERSDLIERLATAAGITTAQVQEILDEQVDFPPAPWINAFAAVLEVPDFMLAYAASDDGSDFIRSLEPTTTEGAIEVMRRNAAAVVSNCACDEPKPPENPMGPMLAAARAAMRV